MNEGLVVEVRTFRAIEDFYSPSHFASTKNAFGQAINNLARSNESLKPSVVREYIALLTDERDVSQMMV